MSFSFSHLLAKSGIRLLSASKLYSGYWEAWRFPSLFGYAEKSGIHVLPVHYYTPIPTAADISRPRRPNSMAGINLDLARGASLASTLLSSYRDGIAALMSGANGYKVNNSSFAPLDAAVLYGMIREYKPKRIVEIGSGMSTLVMMAAVKDSGLSTDLTCIEPYLPDYLRAKAGSISTLIEKPLQDVPLDVFSSLEAGDILFIDSTHVVRFDSDVVYEILELLPRLPAGVIVHVHDIFFPDDYPVDWLAKHRFFWAEQYMLQAFLSMNKDYSISIPLHAVRYRVTTSDTPSTDAEVTSLWLRRN